MPAEPVAIDSGLSLADLETTVGQQEELLGALLVSGVSHLSAIWRLPNQETGPSIRNEYA